MLAAGCGGDGSSESERLDRALAERLAAQSDAVAHAIEANEGCAAADRLGELTRTLDESAGRGEVPEAIRREVERIVGRRFTCVELSPPAVVPPPPQDQDEDEEGKRKKDKQGKKDKSRGHDGEGDDD